MLEQKKHVNFSQLNLKRLENGIEKIRLKLKEIDLITDSMIYQVLKNLRIKFGTPKRLENSGILTFSGNG